MNMKRIHWEILDHTIHRAAGGRFCGDSPAMKELCDAGLMRSAGRAQWCPDEFFTITGYGRQIYSEVKDGTRQLNEPHRAVPVVGPIDATGGPCGKGTGE